MVLAEVLLQALKDHGAREIFGIPGDFALGFFKVVEESGILPLYTFSHEPAVGFAADAAARFNSSIGVTAVTYGAGAFNLVNAVAGAYAERSPVVVVSGAPGRAERASGLELHHQAKTIESQFRVFQEITCDQALLDDPERAPQDIARVLRNARELSLPVYIELPRDMVFAEAAPVSPLPRRQAKPDALAECAEDILARLRAAKAPALMVGVECRRYGIEDKVAALAKRLGLPVVTSFMGRGLLSDTEAPPCGTYLGIAGEEAVTRLVEEADCLLLLGVILSDTNFGVSRHKIDLRRAIEVLGREVRVGHHLFPDIPLDALVEALLDRLPEDERAFSGALPPPPSYRHDLPDDDTPLIPSDIACAVNDAMAEFGTLPITADVGDCLFTAMEIENTRLAAPGYYAGMGFAVPAGLGALATTGERPLIMLGDGAFQMTGWELGNCRRYGWAPVVLVFNNASWEMLRVFQPESRFNDLEDWQFAELATSLGGWGVRVTTRRELKAALTRAAGERERFSLIEIMLPRGQVSDTMARYAAGFKERKKASEAAARQATSGGPEDG